MKQDGSKWTSVAALLVLTLFCTCLLLVLLTGAAGYRRLARQGQDGFAQSTAIQYLATRVHQGRDPKLQNFEDCQALVFSETHGGQVYLTRVYLWDGWLRELFSSEAASLSPEDGEKVLQVEELTFSLDGRLLTVSLNGETYFLTLREGRTINEE